MGPNARYAKLSACILVTSVFVGISSAQNETTVGPVPSSNFADGTISRSVISIAILGAAIILGFVVAKLLEYCYNRRSIRDDDSDMSDYTRELLKAQMLLAFSEPGSLGKKVSAERAARYYGNVWRSKVARNNARRLKMKKLLLLEEEEAKKTANNGTVQNKNTTKQVQEKSATATKPRPALKSKTSTLSNKKVSIKTEASAPTTKQVYRTTPMSARGKPSDRVQIVKEKPEQTINVKKTGEISVQNNNKPGNTDTSNSNNKEKDAKLKKETVKDNTMSTNSIVICRRDSEDLQIPIKVSTDEAVKPKGVTFKRENTASSTSEYDFLSSRNKYETRNDPNTSAATPKSASAIVLEEPAVNSKEIKTVQVKSKLKKPLISSGPQATGNRKAPQTKPQKQNAKV